MFLVPASCRYFSLLVTATIKLLSGPASVSISQFPIKPRLYILKIGTEYWIENGFPFQAGLPIH
jgi:hypothetical protein